MSTLTLAPSKARRRTRLELSVAELVLLCLLAAASFSVFVLDAVNAALNNRVFIGTSGTWAYDQLQYLAWSTDAAHHGLIANLFAFHLGSHVFFDPVWLISGLLHVRVGLSYSLLVAFWQIVALVALFVAVRAYVRALLETDGWRVTIAMLLAIFMLPLSSLLTNRLGLVGAKSVNFETLSVGWIGDDFQLAMAVAAMLIFLLQVPRLLSFAGASESRKPVWLAAAAGVAAAWFHPWQAIVLLTILVMLVLWERPSWDRHRRLLLPALLTALPIAYEALLPIFDTGWDQARRGTAYSPISCLLPVLLTFGPIFLMMAPGYAIRSEGVSDRMLKLWPFASVIVFLALPTDALHAIGGLAIPCAILMVRGWPWVRQRLPGGLRRHAHWLAAAAVAFSVLAVPLSVARHLQEHLTGDESDAELARDDAVALDWIASRPQSSGVLTTAAIGAWVPVMTDQPTWIGHPVWTPSYNTRDGGVTALFDGSMDRQPEQERAFVLATGATFVLQPCGSNARLGSALGPAGFTPRRFGCATVYSKPI